MRGQRDWAFVCAATALGEPRPSWRIATFITEHEAEAPLGYPEIDHLSSPLRAASVRAGAASRQCVGGQRISKAKSAPVAEIVKILT